MSEFALNASETRPSRPATSRRSLPPLAIAGVGALALAGFAVAASSVIGDILVPSPRAVPTVKVAAPSMDGGLASQWPDLKDGLPVVATSAIAPKAEAAPPPAPATTEPMKVASLSGGQGAIPASGKASSPSPAAIDARTAAAKSSDTKAPDARRPEVRIPVPTPVAVVSPPPAAKPVIPSRTAALVPPRETVRARDEAPPPQAASARPRPETVKPVAEAAKPKVEAKVEPAKAREATADKKTPARAVGAPVERPKAVAQKAAPAHQQEAAKTTVASAEPEETDILGVKLPSLAPAGRKIQESVSALGDAVRNAF